MATFAELKHFYARCGMQIGYQNTYLLEWFLSHDTAPDNEAIIAHRQFLVEKRAAEEGIPLHGKIARGRRRTMRQALKKQLGSLEYRANLLERDLAAGIPETDSLATLPQRCTVIRRLRQSGYFRRSQPIQVGEFERIMAQSAA